MAENETQVGVVSLGMKLADADFLKQVNSVASQASSIMNKAFAKGADFSGVQKAIGTIGKDVGAEMSKGIESGVKDAVKVAESIKLPTIKVEQSKGYLESQLETTVAALDNTNARLHMQQKLVDSLRESWKVLDETGQGDSEKGMKMQANLLNAESAMIKLQMASDQTAQKANAVEEAIAKIGNDAPALMERVAESTTQAKSNLTEMAEAATESVSKVSEAAATTGEKTSEVASGVSEVKRQVDELGSSAAKVVPPIMQIGKAGQTMGKNVAKGSNVGGKALQGMGSAGKKTSNIVEKIFRRMAMMYVLRSIRQAISGIGDSFTRAGNQIPGFGKQIDGFAKSANTLKGSFAAMFMPLAQVAIPILVRLMDAVTAAFNKIAALFAMLSGQKSVIVAADSTAQYTDAIDSNTGAAKKNQRQLAGFDTITRLGSNKDSGGGGGGSGSAGTIFKEVPVDTNGLSKFASILDPVLKKAGELKDIFLGGFTKGLGGDFFASLDRSKQHIAGIGNSLKNIFTSREVTGAINSFADKAAEAYGKVSGSVASVGATIGEFFLGSIDKFLSQNGDFLKDRIVGIFDVWGDVGTIVSDFYVSIADIFEVFRGDTAKQIGADLLGIFATGFLGVREAAGLFMRDILDLIVTPIKENTDGIKEAFENTMIPISTWLSTLKESAQETFEKFFEVYDDKVKPALDGIKDGISSMVETLLDNYNTHVAPVLKRLGDQFSEMWKTHIQPVLDKIIELFGLVSEAVSTVFRNVFVPIYNWIVSTIVPIVMPIFENFGRTCMNVFGHIGDAVGGFVDILKGFLNFIIGVFTGDWGRAWDSVSQIFEGFGDQLKGVINGILALVEGMANGVVSGINTVIRAIKKINFTIPDWVPGVGGMGINFNGLSEIPSVSLPRLAQGGFVKANTPQLAMIGDNKREGEIVAPESKLREAVVDGLVAALPRLMQAMGGGQMATAGAPNFLVQIGDREVVDVVVSEMGRRDRRTNR